MSVFHTYYPFFLALFLLTACNDPFSTSGKDEKADTPRTSDEVHKRSDTSDSGQHPQISYYPEGSVVINEVMAAQTSHVSDPDFGLYPGWIELRNARTEATDISGWEIRGNALSFADGSDVFVIPEGTVLTAGDFLLLWADAADVVALGMHTNFTFGSRGGDIYLDIPASDAGEATAMDAFSFAEADIMKDVSLGRIRFNQNHKGFILPLFEPTPGAGNRLPELRIREFHELDVPGPSGITASPDNHLWMVSDVRNGSIYK
ncbi:lamin tail domain-containing protein, partial [Balneolaceae bacterium ANBcel3]|nr:lamin tail domain-containing protein [Balneolaceae bacterium ANBcel3]